MIRTIFFSIGYFEERKVVAQCTSQSPIRSTIRFTRGREGGGVSRDSHKFFQSILSPGRINVPTLSQIAAFARERSVTMLWIGRRLSWCLARPIKAKTITVVLSTSRPRQAAVTAAATPYSLLSNLFEIERSFRDLAQ